MKVKSIMEKKARENVKFDTAIRIRDLLDEAKKAYGKGWDDAIEEQISALVFEEEHDE